MTDIFGFSLGLSLDYSRVSTRPIHLWQCMRSANSRTCRLVSSNGSTAMQFCDRCFAADRTQAVERPSISSTEINLHIHDTVQAAA